MGYIVVTTRQSRLIVSDVQLGKFATRFLPELDDTAAANELHSLNPSKPVIDSASVSEKADVVPNLVKSENVTPIDSRAFDFFKALFEEISLTDGEITALDKALSDGGIVSEDETFDVIKSLSDVISILDDDIAFSLLTALTEQEAFASESHVVAAIKALSDASYASESHALNPAKILADIGVAVENTSLNPNKGLSDSAASTDLDLSFLIGRNPSEEIFAIEAISLTTTFFRNFSDSATPTDVRYKALQKVLGESPSVTDVISLSMTFNRELADAALATDQSVNEVIKNLAENISSGDLLSLDVSYHLSDNVTIGDVPSIGSTRFASDSVGVQDLIAIVRGPSFIESIGVSDSGSLISQGYTSVDYFEEDYVGFSRTF